MAIVQASASTVLISLMLRFPTSGGPTCRPCCKLLCANSDAWHCGSPLGRTACVGSPCLTPHHSLPRFTLRTARPTNALNEQPSWKEDERSHCTETSCPDDGHSAATPVAGYKCSEVAFSIPPNSTLPLNHSENTRLPTRYQYRVRRGGHTRQLRCTRRCNILHSSPPACPHPLTPSTPRFLDDV